MGCSCETACMHTFQGVVIPLIHLYETLSRSQKVQREARYPDADAARRDEKVQAIALQMV